MSALDPCQGPRPLPLASGPGSGGGSGPTPGVQPRWRPGRWRAAVLIGLHLCFALHLLHWWRTGRTLSPLEPSEAIELSARGVLNAGAVFFALALLSTLVLGRWFCGWACHLVALQDLSRALLLRLGITPRPLRSRLLLCVPLLACLYMFVLPLLPRLVGEGPLLRHVELTTSAFWETFPGPLVALVTFVVCGFLAVLFLGAKGFCTYACPYGAAFALLDRAAPARIKVSDACNACGQCTAVCSSNVLVHAEVRDWGMVVDPGCMKCLDCVAHCPTGALSFGWARPALLRRPSPRAAPTPRKPAFGWGGELFLGAAFLLAFLAWRGLYHQVPFLLALGLSGVLAWVWLLAARLLRRPGALKLSRWSLRREGRTTPAGWLFLGVSGLALLLTLHAGLVQLLDRRARAAFAASAGLRPELDWSSQLRDPVRLDPAQRDQLLSAVEDERLLRRLSLVPDPAQELRLAWYFLLLGDDPACEGAVQAALVALPHAAPPRSDWAEYLLTRGRVEEALAALREAAALDLDQRSGARRRLGALLFQLGRHAEALVEWRTLLAAAPDDPDLNRLAGLSALGTGDRVAAEAWLRRSVEVHPSAEALTALAFLLDKRGEAAQAARLLEEARALESGARR